MKNDDGDDELFLWYGWPTKGVLLYFHQGPLSEILTIADIRHAGCRSENLSLSSGFVEWSCAVVITNTQRRHRNMLEEQNMVEELFPGPFQKNRNWVYFWINSYMQFAFVICQVEDYQNILKLSCIPLTFISNKAFIKSKKKSGTSLLASFSVLVLMRNISDVISY